MKKEPSLQANDQKVKKIVIFNMNLNIHIKSLRFWPTYNQYIAMRTMQNSTRCRSQEQR